MLKSLTYSTLLGLLLVSCSPTRPVVKVKTITKVKVDTVFVRELKESKLKQANLPHYKITSKQAKGQDYRQKFLIMHYTAMDHEHSLKVLTEREVSAHYLVNDTNDNDIHILVGEDERAWHAGVSYWNGRTNINDSSIGIEIVNNGYYVSANDKKEFYDFPEYQIKKVAELAKDIVNRYEIEPTYVLGHSDVAPQRKFDPGPKFPWKRLYDEYQIGAWYDEDTKEHYQNLYPYGRTGDISFILSVQEDLKKYGYEIEMTGDWDKKSKRVLSAFQMHFRPENFEGEIDAETWAILKALLQKYKS